MRKDVNKDKLVPRYLMRELLYVHVLWCCKSASEDIKNFSGIKVFNKIPSLLKSSSYLTLYHQLIAHTIWLKLIFSSVCISITVGITEPESKELERHLDSTSRDNRCFGADSNIGGKWKLEIHFVRFVLCARLYHSFIAFWWNCRRIAKAYREDLDEFVLNDCIIFG